MLDSLLARRVELLGLQFRAARLLHLARVRADQATALAGIAGILAAILFAIGTVGSGVMVLQLSVGLDAVDGTIARQF